MMLPEARRAPRYLHSIATENNAFHRAIVEASGNTRLISIHGNLIEQVIVISTFSGYTHEDLRRSLWRHNELVDAFEQRDGLWAASVMRSQISAALHACLASERRTASGEAA